MGLISSTDPAGLYLMNSNKKKGIIEHVQTTVSRPQTKNRPRDQRFLLPIQFTRGEFIFRVLVGPLYLLAGIFFIDFGKPMSLTTLLVKRLKIEGALHNPNGITMQHFALAQPNYKQLVLFCHYPFPPNCQNWLSKSGVESRFTQSVGLY